MTTCRHCGEEIDQWSLPGSPQVWMHFRAGRLDPYCDLTAEPEPDR